MALAEWTIEDARGFIRQQQWTFAKTMPEAPHCYVVRQKVANDADFDRFVRLIRREGDERRFGKRPFTYLTIDGFDYWTMGAPVQETIIINRARSPESRNE